MTNREITSVFAGFIAGAVFGAILAMWAALDARRAELISIGAGQYCPNTGEFAVKGKCE